MATNSIVTDCSDRTCSPDWGRWQSTRHAFQNALNNVWVYGSDAAAAQVGAVSAALPPSVGFPEPEQLTIRFQSRDFASAYRQFQGLMCRELPAVPRKGC